MIWISGALLAFGGVEKGSWFIWAAGVGLMLHSIVLPTFMRKGK